MARSVAVSGLRLSLATKYQLWRTFSAQSVSAYRYRLYPDRVEHGRSHSPLLRAARGKGSGLDQTARSRICPRAGARGGARASRPRCVRIFSITGVSKIAAMIFSSPPQFGQCSRSRLKTRPGHQRRQPLHELQRRHHQMRGAVAPGCFERQHHLANRVALYPFVGQRRASDVTAQSLQCLALVGGAAHRVALMPLCDSA